MPAPRAPHVTASAPAAPPPAPKAPVQKSKRKPAPKVSLIERKFARMLQGETRSEMLLKYQGMGVVFAAADLELNTPTLRRLAKKRLAALQVPDDPDAA